MVQEKMLVQFHNRAAVKNACTALKVDFDVFCAAYVAAVARQHGFKVVRRNLGLKLTKGGCDVG